MAVETTLQPALLQLFSRHAATGVARQLHIARLLLGQSMRFDPAEGRIVFDGAAFAVQLIGLETRRGNTAEWSWTWPGRVPAVPEATCVMAGALREHGVRHGLTDLTTPTFAIGERDAEVLAIVASALAGANGHVRMPIGDDRYLVALITDSALPPPKTPGAAYACEILQNVTSQFPCDARTVLDGFFAAVRAQTIREPNAIVARIRGGTIVADFDDAGAMKSIRCDIPIDVEDVTNPKLDGALRNVLKHKGDATAEIAVMRELLAARLIVPMDASRAQPAVSRRTDGRSYLPVFTDDAAYRAWAATGFEARVVPGVDLVRQLRALGVAEVGLNVGDPVTFTFSSAQLQALVAQVAAASRRGR